MRSRNQAKGGSARNASTSNLLPIGKPVTADSYAASSASEEVQRRIAALKARNTAAEPSSGGFEYNLDEPLRLKRSK
jgi:hypothetical protein